MDAVRRALGIRRVGHAGTLDPFATGLLVILIGRATRLAQFLAMLPKCYTGAILLGIITDTDDRTGTVLASSDSWSEVSQSDLARAARSLTGRLWQQPPAFSAKKIAGQRSYRLARQGKPPPLSPRQVDVHRFTLHGREGPRLRFEIEVSGGTYVRALARDFGEALGCGAHLESLRRTAVGDLRVDNAIPLAEVHRAREVLYPPLAAVRHLPQVVIDQDQRLRVAHGQALAGLGAGSGPVALVAEGSLVAVAEPHGGSLKPRVVLEG